MMGSSVVGANTCQAIKAIASGTPSKKVKRYVLNGSGPNSHACEKGLTECQVGVLPSDGFECIDAKTDLESCGGCTFSGEGQDCGSIPGVEGVSCQSGHCVIRKPTRRSFLFKRICG